MKPTELLPVASPSLPRVPSRAVGARSGLSRPSAAHVLLALLGPALAAACVPAGAGPAARSTAEDASPARAATASPAALPASAAELPEWLSGTGLYADLATGEVAPDVWPFEPQYPLWTDGALKRRWIHVPAGSAIDASDPDAWVFPAGTKLWKEFAVGRRVETRYLLKRSDGAWLRAAYVWSEDGRDARLAPAAGVRGAAESAPGVPYDVPGRADCATCHAKGDGVLGFGALQLSGDRDPLAPHARRDVPAGQDLAAFVARGLVRGLPAELVAVPPRIAGRTPRERAALGYLSTQCGSCHWKGGLLAGLEMELDAHVGDDGARALGTTLGRVARFQPAGAGAAELARLEPGAPEASALFLRLSTREPSAQMPPLGTHLVDPEGRELLAAWIREDLTPNDSLPRP